jgi:two-component system, cell cycle response regulator
LEIRSTDRLHPCSSLLFGVILDRRCPFDTMTEVYLDSTALCLIETPPPRGVWSFVSCRDLAWRTKNCQHRSVSVMKILLVEDSRLERLKIGRCLTEWRLDFVAVESGAEAFRLLESNEPPNMVLLDWMLPDLDGIDICRRTRANGARAPYIYIVMLTAKSLKQDLLIAMAAGADDYLAKPVDPSELRARIMAGKRILELQQSLRFAATHDSLTNLLNRSEILAAIDQERSRSGREGKSTTIIMADIDYFKRINDSLGHAAGDEVLKEVGRRLKSDLRPYDVVGRYGGEEFLIVLPGCNLMTGARRADELRNLVAKDPIFTPFGTTTATISLGVTATSNRERPVSDLLHEADLCMYAAKKKGRNRVEFLSAKARQKAAGQR